MIKTNKPLHGLRIAGAVLLALLGVLLQATALYFLWNWLVPAKLDLPPLTPIEAGGLFVLSKILFGRIRFRYPPIVEKSVWRLRLDRRIGAMNEAEREQFRHEMAERLKRLGK